MSAGEGVKRFWARVVAEVWRRDVMLSLWVLFALGEEEVVWIVDVLLKVRRTRDVGVTAGVTRPAEEAGVTRPLALIEELA